MDLELTPLPSSSSLPIYSQMGGKCALSEFRRQFDTYSNLESFGLILLQLPGVLEINEGVWVRKMGLPWLCLSWLQSTFF